MTRIVVAVQPRRLSDTVCAALEHSGLGVRFRCHTGAEAIRAVKKMGGGVIICSPHLPDMSVNELAEFTSGEACVLVTGKPQLLSDLADGVYTLPLPAKYGELADTVEKLVELDDRRAKEKIPERTAADRVVIEKAKALIIKKKGLSETAAHRYLQRRSMESGLPMTLAAKAVLSAGGEQT